jgi:hypothetical protein
MGLGADVFISYGSDDVEMARELRRHLERGGYTCWMAPDDVAGPKSWAEQIVEAIASCKVVLVLISSVANRSTHVSKEVDLAMAHGKAVLPVRVEDVAPTGALQYLLALAQWIDAFPGGLGPHADEVRRRVAAIIEAEAPVPIEGSPPGPEPATGYGPPMLSPSPPSPRVPVARSGAARRTWILVGAGVLAAVLIVVGIVWLAGGGDDAPQPTSRGDDSELDGLWEACAAGEMGACDALLIGAPTDSEYAEFGSTCGFRIEPGGECAVRYRLETYGDDPSLDALWDGCNAEEFDACSQLFEMAPVGSEYEWFGGSCGGRVDGMEGCGAFLEQGIPDAQLEELAAACEAGAMESCDELYRISPVDSDLEEFAATCGFRKDRRPCAFTYGDSPRLDELWDACTEGAMDACNELWRTSEVESEYEWFGATCGARTDVANPGACGQG